MRHATPQNLITGTMRVYSEGSCPKKLTHLRLTSVFYKCEVNTFKTDICIL